MTGSYERGSGEADSLACPESEEDTEPANDHTTPQSYINMAN